MQHQFAVVLEQKKRTRQQLKQTLSTVQLPISTQVVEQLKSAFRDLDSKLSQQAVLINQINQLSVQDFLLLRQQVRAYFEAKPPEPPTQAERQRVSQEMSRLDSQINQLKQQHSSLVQAIEQMQKNPFRLSNQKLNEAFVKLKQTSKSIEHAMAKKGVCLQQLQQWAVTSPEHLKWSSSPQTAQMRQVASVLRLPMMQSRLSDIQQDLQRCSEVRRDQQQGHQRRSGRGR